ncbi:MAG: hypothetical protein K2X09_04140 [Rickettsiales bacterium]|nr:hypothetical protein [Rickettsiales bacterium]
MRNFDDNLEIEQDNITVRRLRAQQRRERAEGYDDRGAAYSGRYGGQGPQSFSRGDSRGEQTVQRLGESRGGQGQGQQDSIGQQFVNAVVAANQGSVPAREEALRIAQQFTVNGVTNLPVGAFSIGQPNPLTIGPASFGGPEDTINALSRYLETDRDLGKAFTMTPAAPRAATPARTDRDPDAGAPTLPPGQERPPAAGPGAGSGSSTRGPNGEEDDVPDPRPGANGEETDEPGAGAGTGAAPGASTTAKPAAGAVAAAKPPTAATTQTEMNKKAQVALERLGLETGRKNGIAFDAGGTQQELEAKMDGKVGEKTGPSLKIVQKLLNMDPTGQVSTELLMKLQDPAIMAELGKKLDAQRSGKPLAQSTQAGPAAVAAKPFEDQLMAAAQAHEAAPASLMTAQQLKPIIDAAKAEKKQLIVADLGDGKYRVGAAGGLAPVLLQLDADGMMALENSGIIKDFKDAPSQVAAAAAEKDIIVTASRAQVAAAKDPAKLDAAVAALKNLAGKDNQISAADLQSLNPEKAPAGEARTQAGNKLGALANALNLNDDTQVDKTEIASAVAASGIRVEGGAAAFNPLFRDMTFASASAAQADVRAAVTPAVTQDRPRMPVGFDPSIDGAPGAGQPLDQTSIALQSGLPNLTAANRQTVRGE